jgi:L-threonylcarbamoyladenylate synthase
MNTIPFQSDDEIQAALPGVVDHLRGGGVIAYPTETVYGFGCALRADALARLAALKQRTGLKPFLLLISGIEQAGMLHWTEEARTLARAFWPGPLTIALAAPDQAFPPGVRGLDGTVAVRATSHAGIQALVRALGEPITSSSANAPGRPAARTAEDAGAALAALGARAALVLDGGTLPPTPPSTVVDAAVSPPRVIRAGAVPVEELRRVIGEIDEGG